MHTAGAGIHPRYTLPITLDVGCNTASVREDPFYVGLRQVLGFEPFTLVRYSASLISLYITCFPWVWPCRSNVCDLSVSWMQERVRGQKYDDFIDEVLTCLRQRYGASLVIHWEDFGASNAFRLLARYRERVETMPLDKCLYITCPQPFALTFAEYQTMCFLGSASAYNLLSTLTTCEPS